MINRKLIPIFPSLITLVDISDSRINPAFVSLKTRQAMILTTARYGFIPIDLRGTGTVGAYTRATVAIPKIIVILQASYLVKENHDFLCEPHLQVIYLPIDQYMRRKRREPSPREQSVNGVSIAHLY